MIDPGTLRTRLALEAPAETPDGAGGVTRTYTPVADLWAAVTPVDARFDESAASAGATVTHRIVVRAPLALDLRHRFRLGARIFRIRSVRELDATGRLLAIDAEERRD